LEDLWLQPEADLAEGKMTSTGQEERHQTMKFSDGSPDEMNYEVPTAMDKTRSARFTQDVSLAEFLSRPIRVATYDWSVGGNMHHTLDPWSLFFENKRVINRITNYELLKATLKVKFVINGNGFYYGRLIASYLPHAVLDDFSKNRSLISQDIIQASQQPHVYLDPTTSTGGTLTLPFFHFYDFLSISSGDWDNMGLITLRSINELVHANEGTDTVNVSVFVWAENVELAIPTSLDATDLVAQADMSMDEVDQANAKGVISGPATRVAAVASSLKAIPGLSAYATATEAGAKMVASTAKLMGFSRPLITKAPDPIQPSNVSSMALCTVPDTSQKLTVDDKQGLGMGSEIAGIKSDDPLSVLSIAQRESYLTTFTWPVSSASESLIWNMRITPSLHDRSVTSGQTALHLPALAVAALPFQYWTGKIKIRFQIVCSAYHRGRLRLVYDPNHLDATTEYNVNYQEIIDITEKQDFTIEIANSQPRGILAVNRPQLTSPATLFDTARFASDLVGANGVVGLYVVNELVTPNSTAANDAQINVFVSAGDDFKVFSPWDDYSQFDFLPQSDMDLGKVTDSALPSAPVNEGADPLSSDKSMVDEITSVYAGECIGSFRQMLRRYNKHSTLTDLSGTGLTVYKSTRNSYPYYRGAVLGAVDTTATFTTFNYSWTPMLHYISLPFAGWRGSIRHKVVPVGASQDGARLTLTARRDLPGYSQLANALSTPTTLPSARFNGINGNNATAMPHGSDGMALTTSVINDVLSFEVPYQCDVRYGVVKDQNYSSPTEWCNGFTVTAVTEATPNAWLDWYVAAGEDYQVYFWTGMPPLYYDTSEPLPFSA
jgi:hypothetical protein